MYPRQATILSLDLAPDCVSGTLVVLAFEGFSKVSSEEVQRDGI